MANEKRVRQNFIGGLVDTADLAAAGTTLNSQALAAIATAIDTTNHMAITLDPDGIYGAPEIAYITAYTPGATTATILRGQEGTSARTHLLDTPWVHGSTVGDFSAPVVRVTPSAIQTIPISTATALAFDTEVYDYEATHDNVTNNSRLTLSTPGVYLLGGAVQCQNNTDNNGVGAGTRIILDLYKNGAFTNVRAEGDASITSNYPAPFIIVPVVVAAGDYYELFVTHTSSATLHVIPASTTFWAVRLTR